MNQSKQFMMIGSILYLVGSAIFLAQAIAAKDFWARTGWRVRVRKQTRKIALI